MTVIQNAVIGTAKVASESARMCRAQPITTALIVIVAAVTSLGVLATTGRTVVAEQQLLSALDDTGARTVEVRSVDGIAAIPPAAVARVAAISGVEWVIGLSRPTDLRSTASPDLRAPSIRVVGESPALAVPPQWSQPALFVSPISGARIGLTAGAGSVGTPFGQSLTVYGTFTGTPPLEDMNQFIVVKDDNAPDLLDRLVLEVTDIGVVNSVSSAIPHALGTAATAGSTVAEPQALLDARQVVEGKIGSWGRQVVLGALYGALILCSLTVFTGVAARRRDFGRRRVLGASRGQLVALVVVQSLWAALAGLAVGTPIGLAVLTLSVGTLPRWGFPTGIAIFTLGAIAIASLPPAIIAAYRDPIRALRVP